MPLFQVDVEKLLANEYWTNRYIVDAATLQAANLVGGQIVDLEQAVHNTSVTITKYRTSDRVAGTDNYIVNPINEFGLRTTGGDALPLFNVARVDFGTGSGRPSRKYLRLPLSDEDAAANGSLNPTTVAFIQNNYATPMLSLAVVDVDGQDWISATVSPLIGMRQLRRGTRRRTTPIIP